MTDSEHSDTIEFVARQISYDGHTVQTKSTSVNDFENEIHNCYFILFNASGNRVYGPVELSSTLTPQRISRKDILSKLGSMNTTCTAYFIANVPSVYVTGLETITKVKETVLDITYSSVDVEDTNNESKPSFFVVPEFDLDGDGTATQCLPMLGKATCDLTKSNLFEVSLKRLFAKISVNIGVSSSLASFDILAAHLFNLPTKVKLTEPSGESAWVDDPNSFLQQQIEGPIDDDNISGGVSGYLTNAYEFYFYAPEYYLSSKPSTTQHYGDQKYKPQMYDTDKFPVLIRVFGKYKASITQEGQDVTYDLYLGEDASTSFTLKRNMFYRNMVKINGITNSKDGQGATLDCRVDVSELDEVEIIGQTANCYIIGKTGTYIYPACKGVWKGGLNSIPDSLKCTKGTTLRILYQDNNSIDLENLAFNPESCEFSFDVTSIDDSGTGLFASNDGNIILGLVYTENGVERTEWSWHLWFINGAVWGIDAFDVETEMYPSGKYLMDRNLGSRITLLFQDTPGVANGLYYRYGRKEPFIEEKKDYIGGGESTSYTWAGDKKSQTDPCPPGYRVPHSTVWDGDATKSHAVVRGVTEAFSFSNIYFPYSGYIDSSIEPQSQGYGTRDTTSKSNVKIPKEQNKIGYTDAANYTDGGLSALDPTNKTGPAIFTDVIYSRYNISNLGILSAQDKELRYGWVEAGTDIISCKVQIGKWKRSGSF